MSAPEREAEMVGKAPAGPSPAPTVGIQLRAALPAVMRLSPKALAIIGGVSVAAIGGAVIYALQPSVPDAAPKVYESGRQNRSERVTGAPADYGKYPNLGTDQATDPEQSTLSLQQDGDTVPVPAIAESPTTDRGTTAAQQAQARAAQEREAARSSRLFLGGAISAGPAASADEEVSPPAAVPPDQGRADGRRSFLASGTARPAENVARLMAPSSPNVVQAGSVIPAALITGIRSDIPGQITAQVTQNIYDSPTGRTLLIPQGARLVGEYDSDIVAGQNRVLLAWDRLILPGGRSIDLGRQPGADASGMAGIADRTDYHWGHMVKAALISTLLSVGAEIGSDNDDRLVRALRAGSQDTIGETGRQLVSRQAAILPTITVRPGLNFRVIVTRDLVLEPVARDAI